MMVSGTGGAGNSQESQEYTQSKETKTISETSNEDKSRDWIE